MKAIQVTQAMLPGLAEYMQEIKPMWENHWLTNMGAKHKQLEEELLKILQIAYITLFANGHLALECALEALELKGEVITTPFTFASTTHAIVRNHLEPVFCDINPYDYTINAELIENLITERTSAIVPVHVYGHVCNIAKIDQIAKKYHLKVIYDAAHAFGVQVDGNGIGNYGDASVFSFHATKVFHTIEGGAVTYKDAELKKIFNNLKNFGINGPESVELAGGNAKMNEFQAAMGLCNLRHIKNEIGKRKVLTQRYMDNLAGIKGIQLPQVQKNVISNYAYFPVIFDGTIFNRDQVYDILCQHAIFARKYFYPLTSRFECYQDRFHSIDTPVAAYIASSVLTLPLYANLSLEDIDRICSIIMKI